VRVVRLAVVSMPMEHALRAMEMDSQVLLWYICRCRVSLSHVKTVYTARHALGDVRSGKYVHTRSERK